jgi:hypothetical protein
MIAAEEATLGQQVTAALLASEYKFARTMPTAPHWYTLRDKWTQPIDFETVVQFIRDNGERERYGRTYYTKLQIGSYKYWTMGAPLKATILINRAKVEERAGDAYDRIAPVYDDLWRSEEAHAEDRKVIELLAYRGGSVLDVGCGTGLLLDHIRPELYLGIDPSRGMLERLEEKFPGAPTENVGIENLATAMRFDAVVSLYGSCNYIPADGVRRIPHLTQKAGRYFLMFYREGYAPLTESMAGVSVPRFQHPRSILPGRVTDFNNFFIIEGP